MFPGETLAGTAHCLRPRLHSVVFSVIFGFLLRESSLFHPSSQAMTGFLYSSGYFLIGLLPLTILPGGLMTRSCMEFRIGNSLKFPEIRKPGSPSFPEELFIAWIF
jgi:hypothetical protein